MEVKQISISKASRICKIQNGMKFWDLGEKEPFTTMSKASMQRVMEAVIKTNSKVHCTYSFDDSDDHYSRASVVYRVEVPIGAERFFEQISGGRLSEPVEVGISG